MTALSYTRFELLRTIRNRRMLVFSLGFPLVLYLIIAGPNKNEGDLAGSGISAPLYYMIGLASFGTINAVLGSGARIAGERSVGWNRQLRITPLSTRTYFRAKVITAYLMALVTIVFLYAAGLALGVRIPAGRWLEMTGLILVGLVPFVVMGLLFGHLLTTDSIGPAIGGTTALLAFLGGTWFPITSGVLHTIAQGLPSYWLVQASYVALGAGAWDALGWGVVAAWTVVLGLLAVHAWRKDTGKA